MKVGSLVRLKKNILEFEDIALMKEEEMPVPEYNTIYTVVSLHEEYCEKCKGIHRYVDLEELPEDCSYDADIFVEVQAPLDIKSLISLSKGEEDI